MIHFRWSESQNADMMMRMEVERMPNLSSHSPAPKTISSNPALPNWSSMKKKNWEDSSLRLTSRQIDENIQTCYIYICYESPCMPRWVQNWFLYKIRIRSLTNLWNWWRTTGIAERQVKEAAERVMPRKILMAEWKWMWWRICLVKANTSHITLDTPHPLWTPPVASQYTEKKKQNKMNKTMNIINDPFFFGGGGREEYQVRGHWSMWQLANVIK